MTVKLSTGLANLLAGTTGFASAFANGVIEIRTGTQPADADQAPTGTLIGLVTLSSLPFTPGSSTNGLTFGAASGGVVNKSGTWSFVGINSVTANTPGWFRFRANAVDSGALSTTLPRLDGTCASSGADMSLSNMSIINGATVTVDGFSWTQPKS